MRSLRLRRTRRGLRKMIDERDFHETKLKVFKTLSVTDNNFDPLYAGEEFTKALNIAKEKGAKVWEKSTRDWWIVSYGNPPFLFTRIPDKGNWTEV